MAGSGVAYWEPEDQRKSEKAPDYKGFVMLEMDYKAGEKLKLSFWQRQTARGSTLLSIKEDNWLKKKRIEEGADQDREVKPNYQPQRVASKGAADDYDDGIPF